MIIEYSEGYLEEVQNLLVELEEYIISLDEDNLDRIHADYREKAPLLALKEAQEKDGKCFLWIEDGRAKGMIIGYIRPYEGTDYLDYTCPRMGIISELIVSNEARGHGAGTALMRQMKNYFIKQHCKYIEVDVFAYNRLAISFYQKEGYHTRMLTMIRELDPPEGGDIPQIE